MRNQGDELTPDAAANTGSGRGGDPSQRVLRYKEGERVPAWVQVGLWGVPSRTAAMIYLWSTLAVAVACAVLGFISPFAWLGTLFILATLWYWAAIRWKDRHAHWSR